MCSLRVRTWVGVPCQDEHPKTGAAYGIGLTHRHSTPERLLLRNLGFQLETS
jgi:hypothetical protein